MHTKRNYFPSKLPCFSFILLCHTQLLDFSKTVCSPVFPRAPAAPRLQEISIRIEPKLCFRCGKGENQWKGCKSLERNLKYILQDGRRMGFLNEKQNTCTEICSLTAVRSAFGESLAFSVSGSPAPQRGSL